MVSSRLKIIPSLKLCPGTEEDNDLESPDVKQQTIEDNRQMTQGMFSYSIE